MSESRTEPLSNVLEFREGPGIMAADFRESGVPLIRLAGLKDGANILDGCNYLDGAKVGQRWSQFRLVAGDTLLSTSASLGEVAVVPESAEGAVPYTGIIRFRPRDCRILGALVRRVLTTRSFRDQIEAMGVGSVMKHFGPSHLKQMTVSYPAGRATQQAIVDVLDALDDKITANARTCALVDVFLAESFAALARDSQDGRLSDLADVNLRTRRPTDGGHVRYLDIAALGVGNYDFPMLISWEDAPGRARRGVVAGDTVWSTVRPARRSHALVLDDDPALVASTGLAVLSPRPDRIAGLFEATRTEKFVSYLEGVSEGSAYPAVRGERFEDAPVPRLNEDQWNGFENLAMPLRHRAQAARVEVRSLAATRDELLPLLMSGKLRVKEAEKVVEEVV